jgi:hypothetical protein
MAKKKVKPMPFDTSDWLRCPELKVLSPDLKGLWMDLLCYMWESVERGVMVKPNGSIYTQEEIVRMLGNDAEGSDTWLDRLIIGGVCGVREDGAIYSRRMVKDAEISQKRREAGMKGGSTTKTKVFERKPPESPVKPPKEPPTLFPMEPEPQSPPPLTPEQKAKAEKAKKYKYADTVTLTRDEYARLCEKFGEDGAKRMIEILDNYKGSKGKKYASDYKAILNWVVERYNEEIMKYGTERQTISNDNGRGSENNSGASTGANQADKGKNGSGEAQASKDYSERF